MTLHFWYGMGFLWSIVALVLILHTDWDAFSFSDITAFESSWKEIVASMVGGIIALVAVEFFLVRFVQRVAK